MAMARGIAGFSETINIRDSTINNNIAGGHGGAIESLVTDLDIIRTTLDGNDGDTGCGWHFQRRRNSRYCGDNAVQ